MKNLVLLVAFAAAGAIVLIASAAPAQACDEHAPGLSNCAVEPLVSHYAARIVAPQRVRIVEQVVEPRRVEKVIVRERVVQQKQRRLRLRLNLGSGH